MRIVHVSATFLGNGSSQKEEILARAQVAAGHEVTILASDRPHDSWARLQSSVEQSGAVNIASGFRVIRLPVAVHYGTFRWCRGVAAAVRQLNPDVWHCHEPSSGLPWQVAQAVGGRQPIVADQHQYCSSFDGNLIVESEYWLVRRWLVDAFYRRCDEVVSPTNAGLSFLVKHHHLDPRMGRVIPLPADTTKFFPAGHLRTQFREQLGYSSDEMVVVTSGHLQPFKRHTELLAAFQRAWQAQPQLRLLIIGTGESTYVQSLHDQVKHLGLEGQVRWIPYLPEEQLNHYFNAADVATWNRFPTVSMAQAAAVGLPLVLSTDPSQSQFLDMGCGLGYPPGDLAAYAQALINMTDGSTRQAYQRHNLEVTKKFLTPAAHAQRYEAVYAAAQEHYLAAKRR